MIALNFCLEFPLHSEGQTLAKAVDDSLLSIRVLDSQEKTWIPFKVMIQWGYGKAQEQMFRSCRPEESFALPRGEAIHLRVLAGESTMVYDDRLMLDRPEVKLNLEVHHWGAFKGGWRPFSLEEVVSVEWGVKNTLLSKSGVGPKAWQIGLGSLSGLDTFVAVDDWLSSTDAKENLRLLEGIDRSLEYQGLFWNPLALGLLKGDVWDGVILVDQGDDSVYLKLLEAGFRLPCFAAKTSSNLMPDHLVKTQEPSWLGMSEALRAGRVIMGQQANLEFFVKDPKPGGSRYGIGEVVSLEKGHAWVPELKFEVNPQLGGVKKVQLYRGAQLIQESLLRTSLRNGEAVFSLEHFQQGNALLVKLIRVNGEVVMSNPIYFGRKPKGVRYYPVEMSWPLGMTRGQIKVKHSGGVKEWAMEFGDAWAEFLPLDAQLEIWSGGKLNEVLKVWQILFDNCALEMRRPMGVLEQLDLWESKFPLRVNLSGVE